MPSPLRKIRQKVAALRAQLPKVPVRDATSIQALRQELDAIESGVLDPPRRTYIYGLKRIARDLGIPERTLRRLLTSNAEFKQWIERTPGKSRRYRMERDPFVVIHLQQTAALLHAAGYRREQARHNSGRFT